MGNKIKREFKSFGVLLRSVPAWVCTLFVLSIFSMNLLANKSIDLGVDWIALDCGIVVSWFAFLTMDIITKHFGPRAATEISLFAVAVNLGFCLIFFLISLIPGSWGEAFEGDTVNSTINAALDKTFGGTWYVVLGSMLAFTVSAIANNFINAGIGLLCKKKPDGFAAYVLRTYVSTAVGQFLDNVIFAFVVSRIFFGWNTLQCFVCALTGMVAELLCEAIFSPLGYAVCKRWQRLGIGKEYFDFITVKTAEELNESSNNGNE
ncbi:MAG: VUT family protein [Clostridia bacterium]|nr:VUT family protein [Clostridia bacterium]